MALGLLKIIAHNAAAKTFRAGPHARAIYVTHLQTNGAALAHGIRLIIAANARMQNASMYAATGHAT